jgi:hypothetical protein
MALQGPPGMQEFVKEESRNGLAVRETAGAEDGGPVAGGTTGHH